MWANGGVWARPGQRLNMRSNFKGKIYGKVIIDENGEFIIPEELRKALNIKPGDKLEICIEPGVKFISLAPAR